MSDSQKWLTLGAVILSAWLLSLLSPVLMPFIIGTILAYLGDPLIDRLEKMRLSRVSAVIIFFGIGLLCSVILLVIVLPKLQSQINGLMLRLPQFISWSQENILPRLVAILGLQADSLDLGVIKQVLNQNTSQISSMTNRLLAGLSYSGQLFLTWFVYLTLTPVVTFYLLRDWDLLIAKVYHLIPRPYAQLVGELAGKCDGVLSEFFRGQLVLLSVLAILYSMGLWIVGLEFSLLIGLLAGALSFVPYLGLIVGAGIAGVVAFMQFHDFAHLFYVLLVFGIVQLVEGTLLSPILIGERIGLHPVTVIFAVMAGGQLFGFVGVLLALPVTAVIVVLLRYAHQYYLASDFYAP